MFPLSIGVAVLRFHLYDLDVVVRKTLIYGAFALFATLIYLGLVVGVGVWLGRDNSFLTMVAAVVVAVTFQPARARLTRFANRVVYGKRATPYEVLSEFSERVGGAYADEDVLPRMARILGEGIGADRADVWLAVDQELRDVAAWPGDVDRLAPIAAAERLRPRDPGRRSRLPGRVGGRAAGRARDPQAGERSGDAVGREADRGPRRASGSGAPQRPLERGAEGAVRRAEGRAEAPGLRAGRGPSPAGAQHPRRRAAAARRAGGEDASSLDSLIERDPAKATEHPRADRGRDPHGARGSPRSGAGDLPAAPRRQGLGGGARGAGGDESAVPVTLHAERDGRFDPQAVEAAVYFTCLEALQNVAKYADAHAVDVRLTRSHGELHLRGDR